MDLNYVRIEKVDGGFRPREYIWEGNRPTDIEYEVRDSEDEAIADVIAKFKSRGVAIFDVNGAQVSSDRKLFVGYDRGVLDSSSPLSPIARRKLKERNNG